MWKDKNQWVSIAPCSFHFFTSYLQNIFKIMLHFKECYFWLLVSELFLGGVYLCKSVKWIRFRVESLSLQISCLLTEPNITFQKNKSHIHIGRTNLLLKLLTLLVKLSNLLQKQMLFFKLWRCVFIFIFLVYEAISFI